MTAHDDYRLADGQYPEFSRMSLRPGIGADFMPEVASTLLQHGLDAADDVPTALRHGDYQLPLGRYLRRELRKHVGKSADAPQSVLEALKEEVQPLREAAFNGSKSLKDELVRQGDVRVSRS